MKIKLLCSLLIIILCALVAVGRMRPVEPQVTLHAVLKGNDLSRAAFSFERAGAGSINDWDLLYGSLTVGEDLDWFSASVANDSRSLIRDLGALNWSDGYRVPVITPLPELQPGKMRNITVDSSADTGKRWAEKNGIFVKAVAGHMYAMHVKDSDSDFYVLFRVENIERGNNCTISWQIVPSPEE